jgi:hypothetical protein
LIDDEDDDEILKKGITIKSVFKNAMIVLFIILGAIFVYVGFALDQIAIIFAGFVTICIGATLIQIRKPEREPVRQTLTILKCESCGITKVRHFEEGDYIFEKKDPCDKCNDVLEVKQIYSIKFKDPKTKLIPSVQT